MKKVPVVSATIGLIAWIVLSFPSAPVAQDPGGSTR